MARTATLQLLGRTVLVAALLRAAIGMAQPAPYSVVTARTALSGEDVKVDIYRPVEFESNGVAVLAHGFTRDRLRDRDLAQALATAGIIAVAPDLPSVVDPFGNGHAVAGLVTDLERGALGLPATPRSRIVLIGTSAGGLATVIAASNLPGLAGWIGLDPVDGTGMGMIAARKVTAPSVVLLADPSMCNLFGSGRMIANAIPSLKRSERLRGASHCDFEGPSNNFCRTMCGRGEPGMADAVRRATVSAALDMLDPPPAAAPVEP
jgi:pimeloyl-ACP methyl ester carboxylesterase